MGRRDNCLLLRGRPFVLICLRIFTALVTQVNRTFSVSVYRNAGRIQRLKRQSVICLTLFSALGIIISTFE